MKAGSLFFRQVMSHITVILFIALTLTGSMMYFAYKGNLMELEGDLIRRVTNIASLFAEQLQNGSLLDQREWQLASTATGATLWIESILHVQQTRQEFFSNISHELKTPLSCVKSITEAFLDGIAEDEKDRNHYLTRIVAETNRMSRLVYDIMDSEQLESGKMRISQERIDLATLLWRQAEKVEAQLTKNNVSLRLQIKTDKHYIMGDSGRFEQVIDNLMSNAIRYAPIDSQITLFLTEEREYLELCIADQGEGITDGDLPLIWERFYRADKSRNRSSGGSGLGLSISRGLVEAMGGTISVQSKKGIGTMFKICIRWVE